MNNSLFGVISTSRKESEKRLPIHPEYLLKIPGDIRNNLVFETGYGESFGVSDEKITSLTAGVAPRLEILKNIGNVILAKPLLEDLTEIKEGGTIWGWSHCVQQKDIVQIAIDKKLTIISFEAMFSFNKDQNINEHVFYQNNELAGYCSVLHALQLKGIDGKYGDQKKILIIGFGSVSHGAIHALQGRGYKDITICTRRSIGTLANVIKGCKYVTVPKDIISSKKFADLINKSDIIVNGILQDPNNPIMFIKEKNLSKMKKGTLVIDVSCDKEMGFTFSCPTTFKAPMFKVGNIDYYGVDHTPTYLWETATRVISNALINYLPTLILNKNDKSSKKKTLKNATDIKNGTIQNKEIISFQNRQKKYPYKSL
ncbi:N(5)-(carboxyethyl)ornithine synthase [Francisella sp. SYW-9]|uniref:N(5)-(carboxyethyl)ornithine synthase n=1 Tax=Francisella sp. SYW-9 TaxID=2610888 RepID=UPI00123DAF02|nr:N(5)-(carboxyethyl)ornithine synthase [Francisella sp. SYW-9]